MENVNNSPTPNLDRVVRYLCQCKHRKEILEVLTRCATMRFPACMSPTERIETALQTHNVSVGKAVRQ